MVINMIEEVVNSILEAEDLAEQKVAEAKAQANDIVATAETNADLLKKQRSQENKAYFVATCKKIDDECNEQAQKCLDELNAQTDAEISAYEKNVDKAVKIILEQLL